MITKKEFNMAHAFMCLDEAKVLVNAALHYVGAYDGHVDNDIWKLHRHAARVVDIYREKAKALALQKAAARQTEAVKTDVDQATETGEEGISTIDKEE